MNASSLKVIPVLTKSVVVASLLGLSSISGAAVAASQCKGLDSDACAASSECGWVESYQRKDGRDVKAFCRTSSKGKSKKVANSKNADQKSAKKVSADSKSKTS